MKNILVPTDFSACANNAIELGFAFAEFFDAKLYLFSCVDIPENWENLSKTEQDLKPESQAIFNNAKVLLQKWVKKAERGGVDLVTIISGGNFLKELKKQVAETQTDFVVMGSHGASGKQEYFIGSNTQKAVRRLHIPVFVLKNPLKEYAFKKVVFASNFDVNEQKTFLRFLNFIKWFSPEKIHLLSINTAGWFIQPSLLMREAMEDFKKLAKDFECETHFYRDFSVDTGIRHFVEEIEADLVVISNQNRSPLRRIFQGSNVEALVNHCPIPVLSLDFQKVLEEAVD
ncbi:MAG: universal stress protein [Saprospiraceae bacterium]